MQFSDTTNLSGLVQLFEAELGFDYGYVSGNTERLKEFTVACNNSRRRYFSLAVQASGQWELDSNTHSDYNIIYTTITSGTKDYAFVNDANGNIILDIYKVLILPSASDTRYVELDPVDENQSENIAIIDQGSQIGTPTKYSKRANAIFFDNSPNYTVASGIKILVNREPDYYTTSDTTKKTGFPYYPEYFYIKPAFEYARRKSLAVLPALTVETLKLEGDDQRRVVGLIAKAYGSREKDIVDSISGESINSL